MKDEAGILHYSQDVILLNQGSWNEMRTTRVVFATYMYSTQIESKLVLLKLFFKTGTSGWVVQKVNNAIHQDPVV